MSKKIFVLVAVLSSLIELEYIRCIFLFIKTALSLSFKLGVGIFTLMVMVIVLINYYKKNVK